MAYTKQVPGPARNGKYYKIVIPLLEQLAALTQKMRLPDAALQLALRRQHIAMSISEIDPGLNCKGLLVGYGHSWLKALLTMSPLSEKKFINDKVFRFYRMCQCQMSCVFVSCLKYGQPFDFFSAQP